MLYSSGGLTHTNYSYAVKSGRCYVRDYLPEAKVYICTHAVLMHTERIRFTYENMCIYITNFTADKSYIRFTFLHIFHTRVKTYHVIELLDMQHQHTRAIMPSVI